MKTNILRGVAAIAIAAAVVFSAHSDELWFDAGIKDYADWPVNGAAKTVEGVGAWEGTRYAELVGAAGARRLDVATLASENLVFQIAGSQTLTEEIISIKTTARLSFYGSDEGLPTPPTGTKCALIAVQLDGEDAASFYVLAKDAAGGTNDWLRMTGVTPVADADVPVIFDIKKVNGAGLVRYVVDGAALKNAAGEEWIEVDFPEDDAERIGAVMYAGDGEVAELAGYTEKASPMVTLTVPALEHMTVAYVKANGRIVECVDGVYTIPVGAAVLVRFEPQSGFVLSPDSMSFVAGDTAMTLPEEGRPTAINVNTFISINEIMASNGTTLKTKYGTAEIDWVELYNSGDVDIDLAGYYLGNDPTKKASKWDDFRIQGACVVPAKGYKIIWCDGDGLCGTYASDEAHVSCNVSTTAGKHTVFLASEANAQSIIQSVPISLAQIKDVSYGPGAADGEWHFYRTPTPGKANTTHGYGPMTPAITFSEPHGYKTEAFDLTLSCPDAPGETIRYTLDGTSPTASSAAYSDGTPIRVTRTTCVRAAVLQDNAVYQLDSSATYLYLDDILTQSSTPPAGFPATGAVNGQKMVYGMSQTIVKGTDRDRLLRGFTNSIATVSLVIDPKHLFDGKSGIYVNASKDGKEWERQTMVEQIDPVNGAANEFSISAGLRIRGAASRGTGYPKHSFRLFFRSEYGYGSLDHPMFGDEGVDSFDKMDLRTSQNSAWANGAADDTFVHETFSRDSQRDMGEPYNRSRYYNLFINGTYWGLYQTEERVDQDYAASYNKGSAQDYDIVRTSQPGYKTGVVEGETAAWENLWRISIQEGFDASHPNNYNRLRGLDANGVRNPAYPIYLNETNLVNMMLTAQFTGDGDAPSNSSGMPNNIIAFRNRIDGAGRQDGFLWNRHDAEHSLGHNTGSAYNSMASLSYGANNTDLAKFNPNALHHKLCANVEYRMTFADLVYRHILRPGGALTAAEGEARYRSRMAEIDDAIVCEAARWGGGSRTHSTWASRCETDIGYINKRAPYLIAGFRELGWYPSIDAVKAVDGLGQQVVDGTKIGKDDRLYMTCVANGTVYYTLDGSDPRLTGGERNPSALKYEGGSPIPVDVELFGLGSTWKYYQAGDCPAADWMAADFNDATWSAGAGRLGFANSGTFGTKLNRYVNGVSGTQITTYYFRREFDLPANAAALSSLKASVSCDDGYVLYINGVAVRRDNMPTGTIGYGTFASAAKELSGEVTLSFAAGLLKPGRNVIAVEVHQCNATSTDIWWNMALSYAKLGGDATGLAVPPEGATYTMRVLSEKGEWSAIDTISVKGEEEMATQAEAVRVAGVYSSTADGGDVGEFVILTNVTPHAVDLTGVTFACCKHEDGAVPATLFTVAGGRLDAGAAVTITQAEYGWKKITNGEVDMTLAAGDGTLLQSLYVNADWWNKRCDETGFHFVAKEFGDTVTDISQWKPSVSWIEENLRFYEIEGIPAEGDAGEYFVLSNLSEKVALDLTGVRIVIGKKGDIEASGDSAAKCKLTLVGGSAAAHSTVKFKQPDYAASGWTKITDGDLILKIYDAEGALVQYSEIVQKSFTDYAAGLKALRATSFERETATTDWLEVDLPQSGSKVEGDGFLFYLSGEFTEPAVIAPTGDTCCVVLDGATVPGLTLQGAGEFTILASNENQVASLSASAAKVTVEGDGALHLEGENTLVSVLDLFVKSGTFAVRSTGVSETKTPVVNVLGNVKQTGGTIDLDLDVATDLQIYGVFIANKNMKAEFSGGTFTAKVGGTKSAAIYGEKSSVDPTFSGDIAVSAVLTGPQARFVNAEGNVKFKGGTFEVSMPEECATLTDARVFKATKDIKISGGTFTVNVPATGSEIFSTDAAIAVSGGVLSLQAADDCFSATGDITISDGIVHALSTAGDAIDSNGSVTISGGKVFAFTLSADHDAIDVDPILTESSSETHNLIIMDGATVVAVGGDQDYFHKPDVGSTATIYAEKGRTSSKKYVELTGILSNDSAKTTTVLSVNWNKRHADTFTLIATMPGYDGQGYAETKDKPTDVYPNAYKLNDAIDGVFLRDTVEPLKPAHWPDDPEKEITDETKPADLGITKGAFAEATTVELRKLAKWAKAKDVEFGGAAVNAMAFDAEGNPIGIFTEAYLLNCAPTDAAVQKAKDEFRFNAEDFAAAMAGQTNLVEFAGKTYNGSIVIKAFSDVTCKKSATAEDDVKFFRATLTR